MPDKNAPKDAMALLRHGGAKAAPKKKTTTPSAPLPSARVTDELVAYTTRLPASYVKRLEDMLRHLPRNVRKQDISMLAYQEFFERYPEGGPEPLL